MAFISRRGNRGRKDDGQDHKVKKSVREGVLKLGVEFQKLFLTLTLREEKKGEKRRREKGGKGAGIP